MQPWAMIYHANYRSIIVNTLVKQEKVFLRPVVNQRKVAELFRILKLTWYILSNQHANCFKELVN